MTRSKRITLDAAARSLGVSVRDLLRLHREGSLPVEVTKGAGGNRYVDREQFEQWLQARFGIAPKGSETTVTGHDIEALESLRRAARNALRNIERVVEIGKLVGEEVQTIGKVRDAIGALRTMANRRARVVRREAERLERRSKGRAVGAVDWS